jgi:hypothetical protein
MIKPEARFVESLVRSGGPDLTVASDPVRDGYDSVLLALGKYWMDEGPAEGVAAALPSPGELDEMVNTSQDEFFVRASSAITNAAGSSMSAEELCRTLTISLSGRSDYEAGVGIYVRMYCARIVAGRVHPYVGSHCLWWAALHAAADHTGMIAAAAELAKEWDVRPSIRAEIERAIVRRARDALAHPESEAGT